MTKIRSTITARMHAIDLSKKITALINKAGNIAENNIKLGKYHFYKGNFSDAIMRFKGVTFLQPENATAYYYLGRCYLEKKDKPIAIRCFDDCLKYDKSFTQAQYYLSKLQFSERIRQINTALIRETSDYLTDDYRKLLEDLSYQGHISARSMLLNHLETNETSSSKNLLDIGCMGGMTAIAMREKLSIRSLVGIDLSEKAVNKLEREMYKDELLYSKLISGNAQELLGTYSESFDIVIALRVLHYFSSLDELLHQISSTLKPNGLFVATIFPATEKQWELDQEQDRFLHLASYVKEEAKRHNLLWLEERKLSLFKDRDDQDALFFICKKTSGKQQQLQKSNT